jgi:DNA-directed RNA polymerase subunit M/transcription elongation factor TFIIS
MAGENITVNDERRRDDRRRGVERRAVDRRAPSSAALPCPKCGTHRTTFTAAVTTDSNQLSLFRCEVCHSRFTSGAPGGNSSGIARA